MSKLYIIEGLPCYGKSTASKFVAGALANAGKNVRYYDEGSGEHPADYEYDAYVSDIDLQRFPAQLKEHIAAVSIRKNDGYLVHLTQFDQAEIALLMPHKIYDSLPWEVEMPLMLDKWVSFAKSVKPDEIYVFNCVLLQNPMCETMMRFDFDLERSFAYISQIAERIKKLEPAVIYLKNGEIAQSVMRASKEREGWLEAVIDYHVNSGYGRRIDASGFDGYIACLEERQRRELAVLERLSVKKIIVDNPQRDWDTAYEIITAFAKKHI